MIDFIAQWSHALAASLFGAIAIWLARRSDERETRVLALACFAVAVWALSVAMAGLSAWLPLLLEHVRNLCWLGFMYAIWRQGQGVAATTSVAWLYGVLSAIIALAAATGLLPLALTGFPRLLEAAFLTSMVLHMTIAIGALVLVHNLYTAATPDGRAALRLPLFALAAMWVYDLNVYMVSYLGKGWATDLLGLRGVLAAMLAPVFALAALRTHNWALKLSRSMAFQSLSLVAIGAYLAAIVLVTSALELLGGEFARLAQVAFIFIASIAALILLPSRPFRAWFRVKVAKNFFQHRYDYRAEWLRFTDTLGRPAEDALPLECRIIQAVADITESPGGLLLAPDESGSLGVLARWNWDRLDAPGHAASTEVASFFLRSGRVVELDALRGIVARDDEEAAIVPEWILAEASAWAIVPLIHFEKLAGLVVLQRPLIDRTLDWEDFDLLRTVGGQVASYLAEARGHEALADARRFDEFNRRFAFIMHDIKNLVSQLSLVTRNAERHADNPEFRADMIATLKNSTARMNDLLARLSQHNKGRTEEPRPVAAAPIVHAVARSKLPRHPVIVAGAPDLMIVADPARLDQALSHIVQNAIEASPSTEPVLIELSAEGDHGCIAVSDKGPGMSSAFVREKLFRPFASSKEDGFGIGAFEARTLIVAMGGHIEVTSREGSGSRFVLHLPLAIPLQSTEIPEAEAA